MIEKSRVLLSDDNGGIWYWDSLTSSPRLIASTDLVLTDVAVAPSGDIFCITERNIYRVDLIYGKPVLIGSLDTVLYAGHNGIATATGFDINDAGVARISFRDNQVVASVNLKTGCVVNVGNGTNGSPGDLSFITSIQNSYYISTKTNTIDRFTVFPPDEERPERDIEISSNFIGSSEITGLAALPVGWSESLSSKFVGGLLGFDGAHVYDLGAPGGVYGGLIANINLGSDISGASIVSDKYDNWMFGNDLNNNITGSLVGDTLVGRGGNDVLKGSRGKDSLYGGSGNDILNGGTGADKMYGGSGNDIYFVDTTLDRVSEKFGEGIDKIKTKISYVNPINVENLELIGSENISGTGNALKNVIDGNVGGNALFGNSGNDTLRGWAGNDKLDGGADRDKLFGGAGADSFVFSSTPNALKNLDTITDFISADGDRLQFSIKAFAAFGVTSGLSADQFWSGAGFTTAHDQTDRLIYDSAKGHLYYDADGTGGVAAILVAYLSGAPSLSASDILIVA